MRSMLQVFTLHLAKSSPGISQYQEWSIEDPNWARDIYTPVPTVQNGAVQLGDEPGWGVDPHPEFLERSEHRTSTARSVR